MKTVGETAKALRVSIGVIYREIARKRLSCYRIGGAIRISEEQLQDYLNASAVGTTRAIHYQHVKKIGG